MIDANPLEGMDFVSVDEISDDVMRYIMKKSKVMEDAIERGDHEFYKYVRDPDQFIGEAFCEDSTRTRLSHRFGARRAGFVVEGFAGAEGTSLKKKESLRHTLEMLAKYGSKAIVMRHPLNGSARWAVEVMRRHAKRDAERKGRPAWRIPIINGGDGVHEHPTQLILDRFAVLKNNGRLTDECEHPYSVKGLNFLISGDMVYGRVPHSLVKNFSKDGCHFMFVAPDEFQMPDTYLQIIKENGSTYEKVGRLDPNVLSRADAIWGLRFQLERHKNVAVSSLEHALMDCRITLPALEKHAKPTALVYHPLPINKEDPEIDPAIDDSRFNAYIDEAGGGVATRLVNLGIATGYLGHDFEGEVWQPPKQGNIYWTERDPGTHNKPKEYTIKPIGTYGTTIDRLPIDTADEVLRMLCMANKGVVYRGGNVRPHSGRAGIKGLLMIEGWHPTDDEIERIGAVAGREKSGEKGLTVNYIQNGDVVRKVDVFAPDVMTFTGQGSCIDENCISRNSKKEHAITKVVRAGPGEVRCWYCDAMMPTSRLY